MKKYILVIITGLFIGGIFYNFYSENTELTEKKTAIIETSKQYNRDVSNLLIFKDAPTDYKQSNYQLTVFSPDTLYFTENFTFDESPMTHLGMGSYIYYGDINGLPDTEEELSEHYEKVLFKAVDAYYNGHEVYNEQSNNYYVAEQLYFFKEQVRYLISWGYFYDGKNKRDFLNFLDENLVRVID